MSSGGRQSRIRVPVLFLLLGFPSFLAVLAFLADPGQIAQTIAVIGFSRKTGGDRIPLPPPPNFFVYNILRDRQFRQSFAFATTFAFPTLFPTPSLWAKKSRRR
jgi:hypothetical protein